jgi:predicted HNH restriction endonuclease
MPASSDQIGFDFGEESRPAASDDISTRCAHCRDKIVVPAWYIGQTQLHFCDATCRQAWTEAEPSFEVKFGNASKRRGANGEIQARERDSFACQVCGVSEEALGRQLDVHHKTPYRSFSSHLEANKLENLVSVRPSCHAKLEAELRRELPLFKKT